MMNQVPCHMEPLVQSGASILHVHVQIQFYHSLKWFNTAMVTYMEPKRALHHIEVDAAVLPVHRMSHKGASECTRAVEDVLIESSNVDAIVSSKSTRILILLLGCLGLDWCCRVFAGAVFELGLEHS